MLNAADFASESRPALRAVDLAREVHSQDGTCPPPGFSERSPDERLDAILAGFDQLKGDFERLDRDEAAGLYFDTKDIATDPVRSPEMRAYAEAYAVIAESLAKTGTVARQPLVDWVKAAKQLRKRESAEREKQ